MLVYYTITLDTIINADIEKLAYSAGSHKLPYEQVAIHNFAVTNIIEIIFKRLQSAHFSAQDESPFGTSGKLSHSCHGNRQSFIRMKTK